MEKEYFDDRLKIIEEEYEEKKKELFKKYASEKAAAKIGDVIESSYRKIIVEKIKYTSSGMYGNKYPFHFYYGTELNKDGSKKKKGKFCCVSQRDIKTVNGEEYKQ